MQAEEYEP